MLKADGKGDGELPRNIRLALFIAEIVQPYIVFSDAGESAAANGKLQVGWEVGGSVWVDETYIVWGPWPSAGFTEGVPSSLVDANGKKLDVKGSSPKQRGGTRWSGVCPGDPLGDDGHTNWAVRGSSGNVCSKNGMGDREAFPFVAAWSDVADLGSLGSGAFFIIAVAKVDGAWRLQDRAPDPKTTPKSHVVNARTNSAWDRKNAGHRIKGAEVWYSQPLRRVLAPHIKSPTEPPNAKQASRQPTLSPSMLPSMPPSMSPSMPPSMSPSTLPSPRALHSFFIVVILGAAILFIYINRRKLAGSRVAYARVADPMETVPLTDSDDDIDDDFGGISNI